MSIKYDREYYKSWQTKYYKNPDKIINQLKKFTGYYKRWFLIMKESSSTRFRNEIYQLSIDKLNEDIDRSKNNKKISTLAKWLPRENSSLDKELDFVNNITKKLYPSLETPKAKQLYRLTIVGLTKQLNVVECHMSSKEYDKINFKKIPNVALKQNMKSFMSHPETMEKFNEEFISRNMKKSSEKFISELTESINKNKLHQGLINNCFNLRKENYINKYKHVLKNVIPILDTSNENIKCDTFKNELLIALYYATITNKVIINGKEPILLNLDWRLSQGERVLEIFKNTQEYNKVDIDFLQKELPKNNFLLFDKDNIKVSDKNKDKICFINTKRKQHIVKKNNKITNFSLIKYYQKSSIIKVIAIMILFICILFFI